MSAIPDPQAGRVPGGGPDRQAKEVRSFEPHLGARRRIQAAMRIPAKLTRHPYSVGVVLDRYRSLTAEQVRWRLRYSTFVSVSKRYMYFEVPKAACTSMKQLLRGLEGAPPIKLFSPGLRESRRDMFVHARENMPLPSLVDLDDRLQREVLESPDFLRIIVVRNPYTRLASAWRNKVILCEPGYDRVYLAVRGRLPETGRKQLVSFAEFVQYVSGDDLTSCDSHWSPQTVHAFMAALDFNLVGKTENMHDLLGRFARHLGMAEALVLPESNASIVAAFSPYDAEMAARVYSLYKPDFDTLGYRRDDWQADREPAVSSREQELLDEIVERNLVVSGLYDKLQSMSAELGALRSEVRKIRRFHLLSFANALLTTGQRMRAVTARLRASLELSKPSRRIR